MKRMARRSRKSLQHCRWSAAGHACTHVRSRKPLHDTLTAVRLGKAVGECGYELGQNAEQHLRSRLRLANVYSPQVLEQTVRIAAICASSRWKSCATNIRVS